jgi:hypothetical protein
VDLTVMHFTFHNLACMRGCRCDAQKVPGANRSIHRKSCLLRTKVNPVLSEAHRPHKTGQAQMIENHLGGRCSRPGGKKWRKLPSLDPLLSTLGEVPGPQTLLTLDQHGSKSSLPIADPESLSINSQCCTRTLVFASSLLIALTLHRPSRCIPRSARRYLRAITSLASIWRPVLHLRGSPIVSRNYQG